MKTTKNKNNKDKADIRDKGCKIAVSYEENFGVKVQFISQEMRDDFIRRITKGLDSKYGEKRHKKSAYESYESFPKFKQKDDLAFYIPGYYSNGTPSLLTAVFPDKMICQRFLNELGYSFESTNRHSLTIDKSFEYHDTDHSGNAAYFKNLTSNNRKKMLVYDFQRHVKGIKLAIPKTAPTKKTKGDGITIQQEFRKASHKFFGDRYVKIVVSSYTEVLVRSYLRDIKRNPSVIGSKLQRQIMHNKTDIAQLTEIELLQLLLRTREPVVFAEEHVKGNGSDWNKKELRILGFVSVITEVLAYDNGSSGTDNCHVKIIQHNKPQVMFIMSVSAPIMKAGTEDYERIVDPKTGNIRYKEYYQAIEALLLPGLLEFCEHAKQQGKKAVITMPGIGCGEFAGKYKGIMGMYLNAAIKDFLNNHAYDLKDGIEGIIFDPFTECPAEQNEINGIKYIVAPSGKHEDKNLQWHLKDKKTGAPIYVGQLDSAERIAEVFEQAGLPLNTKTEDILRLSIEAGDKCASLSGNDSAAGVSATDQGNKGAATDVGQVHSNHPGEYTKEEGKGRLYKSVDPDDQGYGLAFLKTRDQQLPLDEETLANPEGCLFFKGSNLVHDPKFDFPLYQKLKNGLANPSNAVEVNLLKDSIKILGSKNDENEAEEFKKVLETNYIGNRKGIISKYIKDLGLNKIQLIAALPVLFEAENLDGVISKILQIYDTEHSNEELKVYLERLKFFFDAIEKMVSYEGSRYFIACIPKEFEDIKKSDSNVVDYEKWAERYGHLIQYNYCRAMSVWFENVEHYGIPYCEMANYNYNNVFSNLLDSLKIHQYYSPFEAPFIHYKRSDCYPVNGIIYTTLVNTKSAGVDDAKNAIAHISSIFLHYCDYKPFAISKDALELSKISLNEKRRHIHTEKEDITKYVNNLGADDYAVLDVSLNGPNKCIIRMVAPDKNGKPEYVEMHFNNVNPVNKAKNYEVKLYRANKATEEANREYIIKKIIQIEFIRSTETVGFRAFNDTTDLVLQESNKFIDVLDNDGKLYTENFFQKETIEKLQQKEIQKDEAKFKTEVREDLLSLYTGEKTNWLANNCEVLGDELSQELQVYVQNKIDTWLGYGNLAYAQFCYTIEKYRLEKLKDAALGIAFENINYTNQRQLNIPNNSQSTMPIEPTQAELQGTRHAQQIMDRYQEKLIKWKKEFGGGNIDDVLNPKQEKLSIDAYREKLTLTRITDELLKNEEVYHAITAPHCTDTFAKWLENFGITHFQTQVNYNKNLKSLENKAILFFNNKIKRKNFVNKIATHFDISLDRFSKNESTDLVFDNQAMDLLYKFYMENIIPKKKKESYKHPLYCLNAAILYMQNVFPATQIQAEQDASASFSRLDNENKKSSLPLTQTQNSKQALKRYSEYARCLFGTTPARYKRITTIESNQEADKLIALLLVGYIGLNNQSMSQEWANAIGIAYNAIITSDGQEIKVGEEIAAMEIFKNVADPVKSRLMAVFQYIKTNYPHLDNYNLMISNIMYNITHYASNLPKLNQDLIKRREDLKVKQYKDLYTSIIKKEEKEVVLDQEVYNLITDKDGLISGQEISIQAAEPASSKYLRLLVRQSPEGAIEYIWDVNIPLVGGDLQSTDNTCHSKNAIQQFCKTIVPSILSYIEALKFDINILNQQQAAQDLKKIIAEKQLRLEGMNKLLGIFKKNQILTSDYSLYPKMVSLIKYANIMNVEHSILHEDPYRGFACDGSYASSIVSPYEARIAFAHKMHNELSKLNNPKFKLVTMEDIFQGAVIEYNKRNKLYAKSLAFPDNLTPEDFLKKYDEFASCIVDVMKRTVPDYAAKKENLTSFADMSELSLATFKANLFLEEEDEISYKNMFNEQTSGIEDNLKEQIELTATTHAFYYNRAPEEFLKMAQYFVNLMSLFYLEQTGVKLNFGSMMRDYENDFIRIIKKSYSSGESFVKPVLDEIIQPSLQKRNKAVLEVKNIVELEKRFQDAFEQVAKSPHFDEFILLPSVGAANNSELPIRCISAGGSICFTLNQILPYIDQSIKPQKFEYKDNSTSMSLENDIPSLKIQLSVTKEMLSDVKKTPEEIASLLALKTSNEKSSSGYADPLCAKLHSELAECLKARKDFKQIQILLRKKLDQRGYKKAAKALGLTDVVYLTKDIILSLEMLFSVKANNEWVGPKQQDGQTMKGLLARNTPEDRVSHMLTQLGFDVSPEAISISEDGKTYAVEGEKGAMFALLKQMISMQGTLYLDKSLVSKLYHSAQKIKPELNKYNNDTTKPHIESKIIVALQALFPQYKIRPNIPAYFGMSSDDILVGLCESDGYLIKCENPEILKAFYELATFYAKQEEPEIAKEEEAKAKALAEKKKVEEENKLKEEKRLAEEEARLAEAKRLAEEEARLAKANELPGKKQKVERVVNNIIKNPTNKVEKKVEKKNEKAAATINTPPQVPKANFNSFIILLTSTSTLASLLSPIIRRCYFSKMPPILTKFDTSIKFGRQDVVSLAVLTISASVLLYALISENKNSNKQPGSGK